MVMLMYDAENSNGQNGNGHANGHNGNSTNGADYNGNGANGNGGNGNGHANGGSNQDVSLYAELRAYALDALRGAAKTAAVELVISPFTVVRVFDLVVSGQAPTRVRQLRAQSRLERKAKRLAEETMQH
jgi:hypothetical protein